MTGWVVYMFSAKRGRVTFILQKGDLNLRAELYFITSNVLAQTKIAVCSPSGGTGPCGTGNDAKCTACIAQHMLQRRCRLVVRAGSCLKLRICRGLTLFHSASAYVLVGRSEMTYHVSCCRAFGMAMTFAQSRTRCTDARARSI